MLDSERDVQLGTVVPLGTLHRLFWEGIFQCSGNNEEIPISESLLILNLQVK